MIAQNFRISLIYFAVISSALSAGIFFAFSTFVMRALALQPSASGIATMQSINVTVFNPWFYSAFFGPAVACVMLAIVALRNWEQPGAIYLLAGSLLYLIGTIGVTGLGNVPLNDALAIMRPASAEGAQLWSRYLTDWTLWNHVRTAAAFLAAAMFTFSLP
ncbi:MAG: anthrone oxygenase family protein [Cyanobacteria bacterium J06614_10]